MSGKKFGRQNEFSLKELKEIENIQQLKMKKVEMDGKFLKHKYSLTEFAMFYWVQINSQSLMDCFINSNVS